MTPTDDTTLQRALDQFNAGAYFECHETLEALWLAESSDDRLLYQGLIQVAAAFVHWQRGRWSGMQQLLEAGLTKLHRFPDGQWDLPLETLRAQLSSLLDALRSEGEAAMKRLQPSDIPTIHRQPVGSGAKA